MTQYATAITMQGTSGEEVVLMGTRITGTVLDMLSEITIAQEYRNSGADAIEAVYTFPLPVAAVLLDISLELNGCRYLPQVMVRKEAEKTYEKAIRSGDSVMMLENPEAGLYTMNIGNLASGATCMIQFRYGMLHDWQQDRLRIHLPTVIAPRYGNPLSGSLQPHQVPTTDLLTQHLYHLELTIKGSLATAAISSPSHRLQMKAQSDKVVVSLYQPAYLDKDFVLEMQTQKQLPLQGYIANDGGLKLVWVPFHPQFSQIKPTPLALTIIVDCSGSMQGVSIEQAQQAVSDILKSLAPGDLFGIVIFGNSFEWFDHRLRPATTQNIEAGHDYISTIHANMGGTELGRALDAAYTLTRPEEIPAAILLITDGQISNWEALANKAAQCGQRIFTIGVGSAVTEMAVQEIARNSGGRCELVAPSEDMATTIHRHFSRLRTLQKGNSRISWPAVPLRLFPEQIDTVYHGDTLHQCAWFDNDPGSEAVLSIDLDGHHTYHQQAQLVPWPAEIPEETLPRLIAGQQLRGELTPEEKQELALNYRLISPYTNYCVVIENHQEEVKLPRLRQVRQMMPEGALTVARMSRPGSREPSHRASRDLVMDECFDMPTFLRRRVNDPTPVKTFKRKEFIDLLRQDRLDIDALIACLTRTIRRSLQTVNLGSDSQHSELKAMILVLERLLQELNTQLVSRYVVREIDRMAAVLKPSLTDEVAVVVENIAREILDQCARYQGEKVSV